MMAQFFLYHARAFFEKLRQKRRLKFLTLLQSKNDRKRLKWFGTFEFHLPNFGSPFVPKTNL